MLSAIAYWAPWVDHDAAALKLSGQDMGEFAKFLPQVQSGEIRLVRQLFYLSPFICAVCLVLLGANRQLAYPRWLRVATFALAPFLLTGLLPPVWGQPRELFSPEFRIQGIGLVLGLLLLLAHGLLRRIPLSVLTLVLVALALIALVLPQWAFWSTQPSIWASYGTPSVRVGWGIWLDIVAWLFAALALAGLNLTSSRT